MNMGVSIVVIKTTDQLKIGKTVVSGLALKRSLISKGQSVKMHQGMLDIDLKNMSYMMFEKLGKMFENNVFLGTRDMAMVQNNNYIISAGGTLIASVESDEILAVKIDVEEIKQYVEGEVECQIVK